MAGSTEPLLGLFAWLCSGLLVMLASVMILDELKTQRASLNLMGFFILSIFVISVQVVVVGLLGLLRPLPILIAGGCLAAVLFATRTPRIGMGQILSTVRSVPDQAGRWWTGLPRWIRWLLGIAIALSSVRFGFLIWALPPFVWDSLSYHLTNVGHWIQAARIELFDVPVTRIFNPANYELLAAWFSVFIHHDALIEAAGLPGYVLGVVATYAATRGLGRSKVAAVLSALAFGSTPAVILAATGTKNDIHIAAYYLAALALVIDLSNRHAAEEDRHSLSKLTVLALVLCLAIGTKTYIVHLIPGLALVALLRGSVRDGVQRWRANLRSAISSFRSRSKAERRKLVVLLFAAISLGGFWNARNWIVTGNPFYPYEVLIVGRSVFEGPESEFRLDVRELAANLENIGAKFGDWRDPIRPDLPNTTGWGWFAYVIGLPALLWAVIQRARMRVLVMGFVVSFLVLMLSTGPSPWNMRFAIWFPAIFGLCFAELVDAASHSLPSIAKRLGVAYAISLLFLNFVGTLNYNRVSAEEFRSMLRLPLQERDAARFADNMPVPYQNANEIVPAHDVLGFNTTGNGFIYPLYRADFSQQISYIPFEQLDECKDIAAEMLARGTRYLLVAPEHTEDEKIALLRKCSTSGEFLRERARGLYVIRS